MAIFIQYLAAESVFGKLEIMRCPRPILAPVQHRVAVSGVLHRSIRSDIRRSIHLNATTRLQTEVEEQDVPERTVGSKGRANGLVVHSESNWIGKQVASARERPPAGGCLHHL